MTDNGATATSAAASSASAAQSSGVFAVLRMAVPFTLICGVQAVLTTTDTWFVGRISTLAVAALSVVGWFTLLCTVLFGGATLAVQLLAAQAQGSRRYARASLALWSGIWSTVLTWPIFAVLALNGATLFAGLGFDGAMRAAMDDYWTPRILGAPIALALMGFTAFFCGIDRAKTAFWITTLVAVANVLANYVLVVWLDFGIAGSAWATNVAQVCGAAAACACVLRPELRVHYRSDRTARPRLRRMVRQFALGIPISLQYVSEFFAFAVFQLIEARLGKVDAAATQIVLALTSFCYLPASGMALAATTLVGNQVGARRTDLAFQAGNKVILITVVYMLSVGLLLALGGTSIIAPFTNPADPDAAAVVSLAGTVLWIALAYQFFDGLGIACGACLRGAADVRIPAAIILVTSCLLFVPLAHSLAFAPGNGWLVGLPQFGFGTLGAWIAALAYIAALGLSMYARWCSQAWRAPHAHAVDTSRVSAL